jgi:hypothetical protein
LHGQGVVAGAEQATTLSNDDLAGAGTHHVRVHGLRAKECAREISIHHQVPILRGQVFRLCANGRAGVVDKDVETSESLDGALDRLPTGYLVENIQLDKPTATSPKEHVD